MNASAPVAGTEAALLVERATRSLHQRGERMTTPRRAVLHALAGEPGHLGAEEVTTLVAGREPAVHRASVYRALEALTAAGIVQHVHLAHGATAYHLAGESNHLHAQCRRCGRLEDLPADLLDAAAQELRARWGFVLDSSHVALSGLCRACRTS